MLSINSSYSCLQTKKSIDIALKHKIRNLRAKLKNLLFNHSCIKHSKRQIKLKKIQKLQNQNFYNTKALFNQQKHRLTHTKQQPKHFWYSQKHTCNLVQIFSRLSNLQIQQIKEDMLYYLGEENIKKFKDFLQFKQTKRLKKLLYNKNQEKPLKKFKTQKQENIKTQTQLDSQNKLLQQKKQNKIGKDCSISNSFTCFTKQQTDQSNFYQNSTSKRLKTPNPTQSDKSKLSLLSTENQTKKFQANYLGNRHLFLNKRRILDQEQDAQRILTQECLKLRQDKAVQIIKATKDSFLSVIKGKNTYNQFKTKKILEEKYKKNERYGTIVQLNEELRQKFFKKKSKTSQIHSQLIKYRKENIKQDTTLSNFFKQNRNLKI